MVSLIRPSPNHFLLFSSSSHSCPPNSSSFLSHRFIYPRNHLSLSIDLLVLKPTSFLGFSYFGYPFVLLQRGFCSGSGFLRIRRSKGWETEEGDPDLEREILEFMRNSENPYVFPKRKDLIEAGRSDLVDAIEKTRGWLSLGWDFDDDDDNPIQENEFQGSDSRFDFAFDFLQSDDSGGESDSCEGIEAAGTSGRPMQIEDEIDNDDNDDDDDDDDCGGGGIEGILSRLEKERLESFGVSMASDYERRNSSIQGEKSLSKDRFSDYEGTGSWNRSWSDINGTRNSLKSDINGAWNTQNEDYAEFEFEVTHFFVSNLGSITSSTKLFSHSICHTADENGKPLRSDAVTVIDIVNGTRNVRSSSDNNIGGNQIESRLQHLELELSSALRVLQLRTKSTDIVVSHKDSGSSPEKLHELSDTWEYQETKIMNARDKLRSTRAKLAVLEGKMGLAIIEAQKMTVVKQKRINDARRALNILRTASVVWPGSASVVLLTGSFDGWTSQRVMERSSSGIFSLSLKLYPGRYEIKFIVDGVWKIDPLRPIVNNNGHENNLLIVS